MRDYIIEGASKIEFEPHGDYQGTLVAVEELKDIEFDIKRIYYIYDTLPDVIRGKHAHRKIRQVILPISGSCEILLDNGKERETVLLDKPNQGIYLYGFIWREMKNFSKDCVLMCMVNTYYDVADYVYEYDEFRTEAEKIRRRQ